MRTLVSSALLAFVLSGYCHADVYVVTAAKGVVPNISNKDLQSLYMGRRTGSSTAEPLLPTDLPRNHPAREEFYKLLTGMSAAQVNSHWARLLFSGQTTPPVVLPDEDAMQQYLRRTDNTLGYLSQPPTASSGLRIISVLRSKQENPAKGNEP